MIKLLFQIKTFFSANNVYFIKNYFFFKRNFFFSNLVLQQRNSHSRTFSHLTFYIPLEVYIIIDHSWKLLAVFWGGSYGWENWGLQFCKSYLFWELYHEKTFFYNRGRKRRFFPCFHHEIIFYSAELFDCAFNFKFS